MIKMSYNRCKDIYKFGNKYLPSAYKTQVEFRSHFWGKKCVLRSEKYGKFGDGVGSGGDNNSSDHKNTVS